MAARVLCLLHVTHLNDTNVAASFCSALTRLMLDWIHPHLAAAHCTHISDLAALQLAHVICDAGERDCTYGLLSIWPEGVWLRSVTVRAGQILCV